MFKACITVIIRPRCSGVQWQELILPDSMVGAIWIFPIKIVIRSRRLSKYLGFTINVYFPL